MKTVIFVRHGQYSRDPEKLTVTGRKQAKLTARLLAKGVKADKLFSSTMPRAIETAQVIGKALKLPCTRKNMFREGALPIRNRDFEKVHGTKLSKPEKRKLQVRLDRNQRRAELAFRSLFKKSGSRGSKKSETVILVSHGNVIRYWICRTLGIDVRKWLAMDIHQCSVTTIQMEQSGEMRVLGFSDIGHMPHQLRTYL